MNLIIFIFGINCGVSISVLIFWLIVRWSNTERVKIRKRGLAVTEQWVSGITRGKMENYVN